MPARPPPDLWDTARAAEHLGISVRAVRAHLSNARHPDRAGHRTTTFPLPEVILGQSPGWHPATIRAWAETRPDPVDSPPTRVVD
jgi:hypothetical protein